MTDFNGLGLSLGNLPRLCKARTRSISAENPTGEKGMGGMSTAVAGAAARELGPGWKASPAVTIEAGQTHVVAEIPGQGAIQSIWFGGEISRDFILRIHWDFQAQPSVECPLGDFFAYGWTFPRPSVSSGPFAPLNSLPVAVNPNRGMNCFWEMPFRRGCHITLENRASKDMASFYQINYALTEVPEDVGYFHAQFRRVNPLPYKQVYTIVDGINGTGHYVGTALSWGTHNCGWWGEGEIKFYMDGDTDYPTICGTGTEDYFGGSFGWEVDGQYTPYSTPFMGMYQVVRPDGLYRSQQRFSMYRWHIMDPVRFEHDLRVTIQALGWRSEGRFLPLQDDIASVAYWYQSLPTAPFPELPDRDYLEII
jgi:hypothetical protein